MKLISDEYGEFLMGYGPDQVMKAQMEKTLERMRALDNSA